MLDRLMNNPRLLFWIALVAIIVNCSFLTITRTLFKGESSMLSIFLDFTPLYSFLFAFWFFKNLAQSTMNSPN